MSNKFQIGQIYYMIATNRIVQPVTIIRIRENKCLVKLERSGEMWVTENRLFENKADAEKAISEKRFTLDQPQMLSYIDKLKRRHERPDR